MLMHTDVRNGIHRVCSRPSFRAAAVLWAIGFSISWCSTLGQWRRDSNSDVTPLPVFSRLHADAAILDVPNAYYARPYL